MSRIARAVATGEPHHITHRGKTRQAAFFESQDRHAWLSLLQECAHDAALDLWAWCQMTNHVHLIAVPQREDSLARALHRCQMRYSRWLNRRRGRSGHLWANRFYSTALDAEHLWEAVRYVEANPLRAGIVATSANWPWSSCANHAGHVSESETLLRLDPRRPFPGHITQHQWISWIDAADENQTWTMLRKNAATGRPTADPATIRKLEQQLGRTDLERPHRGRPKKFLASDDQVGFFIEEK